VHGAQDSSSFILLHEHSKVFKIIYTNCSGNVCPGKWLSGKRPLPDTKPTHRLKWRHSNLWSQLTIRSLCCGTTRRTVWSWVVKTCRVIRIKLNQMV